jgi:hypothetical protein
VQRRRRSNGQTRRILSSIGGLALLLGACASPPTPPPAPTDSATVSSAVPTANATVPTDSFALSPSPSSSTEPSTTGTSGPSTDRYADGIPEAIDGKPVLRGKAALARAAASTDTTPFLVGGWVTYVPGYRFCTAQFGDQPWSHDCTQAGLSDAAGALEPKLTAAVTFHFVLTNLATGPVVAHVEVHDPRASSCGTAAAVCDRMMVVQQVVWAGDAATAPRPISADAVAHALATVQPGATVKPGSDFCADALPAAQVETVKANGKGTPRVTAVEVEPSTAARRRAVPQDEGAAAAFRSSALVCTVDGLMGYRWLVVANVAVMVRVHLVVTASDRAFVDRLATALTAAGSTIP